MTSSHPMESGLAGAVRAGAAGLYSLEAACELVIGTGWLHRDDFARFVSTGTSLTDGVTELAHIDWQSVISNRDAGLLPCGSGENRILRMAASIAAGIPVDLNDVLCGLDQASITLVVRAAVTRTDSVPPISPDPDDMTCVTRKTGNRHTARHHQRETSALGTARQNRYTNPLHTASAERSHTFVTTMQMGRIASDASFGTLREHALPAAQRAALRCHQPAGPPRGCGDLGLRRPSVCDATMMRLMPLRCMHHRSAC